MKGQIQSLEVSYIVHATEDAGKIGEAVASLLDYAGEAKADEMEGHFGNSIVRVRYHIIGDDAQRAFERLASNMGQGVRKQLIDELDERLDEHSALYLRFDKQRLLSGRLELTDADPVRIRVKPRLYAAKGGARSLFVGLFS